MKRVLNLVALLVVASLVLPACGPVFAPGGTKYQQGIWIEVKLTEPIRFNQPVPVTITVETEQDEPGLRIGMDTEVSVLIEGESRWTVDTRAGQPVRVTSIVRFTREGWFSVIGGALTRQGGHASNGTYVHITQAGGIVNPTSTWRSGTPMPVEYSTPPPFLATPTPTPTPPPTPRVTHIPPLPPNEVLARCGWAPGQPQPTPWQHARAWVNVPESVSLNTPIPVTLGVGLPCAATAAVRLNLALCRPNPAVQVIGAREWTVEARPGVSTIVSTTLRFTKEGEFELIAGAYDSVTGRVISGGYRVLVSQEQTKTQTGWVNIVEEGFEGYFPGPGWTRVDLSGDGYDRKWGQNDYRAYQSSWAAWPACSGSNAICPEEPYGPEDYYPNNMETRMIYGPFDLSGGTRLAKVEFQLWRAIESGYDYLTIEVSDGGEFRELPGSRRDGFVRSWESQEISLNDYVGKTSVWVAWRFHSDGSIAYEGPWVDNIYIKKYVPEQVTARGTFHYYDRESNPDDNPPPAPHTRVRLYDADQGGTDDVLGETTTDVNGFWQIGSLWNWDDDDPSTNPSERRLDLYVAFDTNVYDRTDEHGNPWARWQVIGYTGMPYQWQTPTGFNVSGTNGIVDFGSPKISFSDATKRAMWLFQDFRRAWQYVWENTGTDPSPASVKWQPPGTGDPPWPYPRFTCYWFGLPVEGVLIMFPDEYYSDVVIHELGHGYMFNIHNGWFWADFTEYVNTCTIHRINELTGDTCAYTEGWADFLPAVVNNDPVLHWPGNPIGNLEMASSDWAKGDECEGRVAAALYDLFDSTNDGLDQASFGFGPIWNVLHTRPQSFHEFWEKWKTAGYEKHLAVLALYQNTINYNNAPRLTLPTTPVVVLQNHTRDNAIDLWATSADSETLVSDLTWQIVQGAGGPCGPQLDGHFVDLVPPTPGWTGSCLVTIQVSDGISTTQGTFTVQVNREWGHIYLPLALKGYSGTRGAGPLPLAATPTPGGYPAPAAPLTLPTPTATPRSYPSP